MPLHSNQLKYQDSTLLLFSPFFHLAPQKAGTMILAIKKESILYGKLFYGQKVTEFSFLLLQVHYPHICTVGTEQFVE